MLFRRTSGREPTVGGSRWRRPFAFFHWLTAAAITALVIYFFILLISRTRGCRSLVESKMEAVIGEKVEIENLHLNTDMELVIRNARCGEPETPGRAGANVERVRLAYSVLPQETGHRLHTIEIENGVISFVSTPEGLWQPAVFAGAAQWLNQWSGLGLGFLNTGPAPAPKKAEAVAPAKRETAAEDAAETRPEPDPMARKILLKNLTVSWWNPEGQRIAYIDGLNATVTPLMLPERRVLHVRLNFHQMECRQGPSMRGAAFEFMLSENDRWLLGAQMGRDAAGNPTVRGTRSFPDLFSSPPDLADVPRPPPLDPTELPLPGTSSPAAPTAPEEPPAPPPSAVPPDNPVLPGAEG